MAKLSKDEEVVLLLKHLLVIELWRGGLTQAAIRARLGLSTTTVNEMLKGVSRKIEVENPSKD